MGDIDRKLPIGIQDFERIRKENSALEDVLDEHLRLWESVYGDQRSDRSLEERFRYVIEKAVFKGFFSTLKSYDRYLKFVFITGVTKFSKVSIFSDLNQLNDISLYQKYSGMCGITETELMDNFEPEIESMAANNQITKKECLSKLKKMYDGYHFHHNCEGVYNSFSLLSALDKKDFGMYWFSTGTPTFLIERLKKSGFDAKQITEGELYADANILTDYRYDNPNPIPLFYQTGYLTIKGYDRKYMSYQLDYPNDEVRYGFLNSLAPTYLHDEDT